MHGLYDINDNHTSNVMPGLKAILTHNRFQNGCFNLTGFRFTLYSKHHYS